jgi:hypothetical protein
VILNTKAANISKFAEQWASSKARNSCAKQAGHQKHTRRKDAAGFNEINLMAPEPCRLIGRCRNIGERNINLSSLAAG